MKACVAGGGGKGRSSAAGQRASGGAARVEIDGWWQTDLGD